MILLSNSFLILFNFYSLLTKGGFTPLGLLNHYLIASDSLREQKRTQSFIQDSIVKQRHSLYEEKEKSKDLLLTLQVRTLLLS